MTLHSTSLSSFLSHHLNKITHQGQNSKYTHYTPKSYAPAKATKLTHNYMPHSKITNYGLNL